jgi:tetratricopeptide (TPR) repeat protein
MNAALSLKPKHRALLGRLRAVHEACGDFPRAVDAAVALAEATPERMDRARAFVAAADLCAQRAKNVGRAVALYEAAIADDPAVPGAFEAIEGVLLQSEDFSGAEKAYVRQLERLEGRKDAERALLHKLAAVRAEKLKDFTGAVQALDRLVAMDPDDVDARARLAALLEENGEDALAVRCLEVAAVKAPTRVATYRSLGRLTARLGDADRAYAASAALVYLGEADTEEQNVYRHFAPRVALAPTQALDDATWQKLQPDDHDRNLDAILSAIAPAVVSLRIDELGARGQLPRLDPKAKQDVEQSTVSAVRTVGWAAKLLGVRVPAIYARAEEVAHGIALVPAVEPTIAIGKALLSGRSVPELTFRITWELAYERLTWRLLQLHPSLAEMSKLVLAGLGVVLKTTGDAEVDRLSTTIASRLDADRRKRLEVAVGRVTARGGTVDLLGWVRSVERTACRAGLLACGDLTVAARILAVDPRAVGGLGASDRIRDLLAFSVSSNYASVRRTLGIAASGAIPRTSISSELEVVVDVGLDL